MITKTYFKYNPDLPTLFCDRDGTLIIDTGYPIDPSLIQLNSSVIRLLMLYSAKFQIAIISNQSGIGRGMFTSSNVHYFNDRLVNLLQHRGISTFVSVFCPHAPYENCLCRKPSPSMIKSVQETYNIDKSSSFMIGDKACDVESAMLAGISAENIKYTQSNLSLWFQSL